jgi:predicted DNA binding CopG/RHH family protein
MKKGVKEIKLRYNPQEIEIIKEKASKLGMTLNEYQIYISKKANVKVEVLNG